MLSIRDAATLCDLEMARGRMQILGCVEASEELAELTPEQLATFMRHAVAPIPKGNHENAE